MYVIVPCWRAGADWSILKRETPCRTQGRFAHALVAAALHTGVDHLARTVDRDFDNHVAPALAAVGRDIEAARGAHRIGQRKGDRHAALDLAVLTLLVLSRAVALADGPLFGQPLLVGFAVGLMAPLGFGRRRRSAPRRWCRGRRGVSHSGRFRWRPDSERFSSLSGPAAAARGPAVRAGRAPSPVRPASAGR